MKWFIALEAKHEDVAKNHALQALMNTFNNFGHSG
jgi:hypothetical protein